MGIVNVHNKQRGVTYVYETVSCWDSETKKAIVKRKLIGKRDEEGNLIPTGPKGRPKSDSDEETEFEHEMRCERYLAVIEKQASTILDLRQQLMEAQDKMAKLQYAISQATAVLEKAPQPQP